MSILRAFFLVGAVFSLAVSAAEAEDPAADDQKAYQAFKEGLQKRVPEFDAQGKSLKQVVDEIRKLGGINIVIDPEVYGKGGTDLTVNLSLTNVRVESILKALLRMYNLVADYKDEVLYVTTVEDQLEDHANSQEVVTQNYNVRSIITARPDFGNTALPSSLEESQLLRDRDGGGLYGDEQPQAKLLSGRLKTIDSEKEIDRNGILLVELLKRTVSPRSWRTDERVAIQYNAGGTVTVTHTLPVHLQVLQLLRAIEK